MKHLALIMDGNGRWATAKGLPRTDGHEAGARALLRAIDVADQLDIEYTTFYAFSTDNQKRDNQEVGNILGIIAYFLQNYVSKTVVERGYRVRFIGEMRLLPEQLLDIINNINKNALNNKGKTLIFAIGYGGDAELAAAVNKIIKNRHRRLDDTPVTAEELKSQLYTINIPDPDVVLRYGGYKRLSNFMPLQTAYSELFFTHKLWPDFDKEDIIAVIKEYEGIKRNFGGINA
ncbi:MAG: polyprenyl diphosphate synthase [Clostridia bacterium]|nr:polyprenyl diphosphate synthase [Clostridia bacterium]